MSSALISAQALKDLLDTSDKDIRVVDASFMLPDSGLRIAHAVDFDIDVIADTNNPLPHMLPTPEVFADHVGKLGIGNNTSVIVYDRHGIFMAASRVWWMFRVFGHDDVRVLNGGMPAWLAEDYPLTPKNDTPPETKKFASRFRHSLIRTKDDIEKNIDTMDETLIDVRDQMRFLGLSEEQRPIPSGHIPGSTNLPFIMLINENGTLKSPIEAKMLFQQANIDYSQKTVTSCGSGVTACVTALALYEMGFPDVAVYDGSWTEWAMDDNTPKVTR